MEIQQKIEEQLPPEKKKPNSKYSSFIEAHSFAKSLSLKSRKEWRAWAKGEINNKPDRPLHVPAHPDGIYKIKGWQGWKHWLGTADNSLYEKNESVNIDLQN
jgi:hypothetical protein